MINLMSRFTIKEFEKVEASLKERGRNMGDFEFTIMVKAFQSAGRDIENSIRNGKKPEAHVLFSEFFTMLMLNESVEEEKRNGK